MLHLLLLTTTLALQTPAMSGAPVDSVYSSPRVRSIVEQAARSNGAPPASLRSYRARVETEMSFMQSMADGRETPLQLEQLASDVYWRADGAMTQEIIGYRAQTLGASFSGLSFFEVPFFVPTLYADRLDLVRTTGPVRTSSGELLHRRTLHPFDAGREAVYSFSGGDTVDVVRLPSRTISIVRVHVTPRRDPLRPTLVFDGDIDLDADRYHIVRMQGRLIATGRGSSALGAILQGVLYVKLENAEYDQEYWLPREQRFEAQAVSRIGGARTSFRTVSRVIDLITNDSTAIVRAADPDSFPYGRLQVTSMSSMSRFSGWSLPIGELSDGTDAHDFDAYAPPSLQPHNQARLTFGTRYLSQLIRFNPVEGPYTGAGLTYRVDDRTRLRAHAGYAWSEQTARGGAEASITSRRWETRIRAERQLAHTADFIGSQPDPGVLPVIAGNEYDFVDRRIASGIVEHTSATGLYARAELGRARDGNVARHISGDGDSLQLTSRADEGTYWIARADLQRNRAAGLQSLQPGLGWHLHYEAGSGDLDWNRAEAGATLRHAMGRVSFAGRADAGVLFSDAAPAQALFDFRNAGTLPGYSDDNVFAGDRAVLARASLTYALPILSSPLRIGVLYLPAIAPSPYVALHAGWTDADSSTEPVLQRLGWRVTDGVRSSIDLRMRFFGGAVSVGAARPLEEGAHWKLVWGWVSEF